MKTLFILTPHSFIDVITNSSTELFVCDTEKSLELIEELLEELLQTYNKLYGKKLRYKDVFKELRFYSKEEYEKSVKKEEEDKKEAESEGRKYRDYRWGFEKKENIGRVVIEGGGDNSIPYEMFDLVEGAFCASRYHLG